MKKKKIGFTCSAFDLCHAGHVLLFKEAKKNCDYLIVGLQDDPSNIQDINYRDKVKNRPVMSIKERKIILEGIKYIDEIFTYSTEADLYDKLKKLKIDIRFLGNDWKGKKYTGYDLPHQPYFVDRSHGYSTTELRHRVYWAERERLTHMSQESQRQGVLRRIAHNIEQVFTPNSDEKQQPKEKPLPSGKRQMA